MYRPDGSNRPIERLGDLLIDERVRIQLFRLEALLRLYVRVFPDLEKYRLSVKNVEDGLGAYTFAVDSVAFAKDKFKDENRAKPPDAARTAEQDKTLQGLEQKHAAARAAFTKLVERSTMETDLPELRSMVLSTFAGWSPSEDIGFVTGELLRVLKKVRHDRFNFNLLEDGIHEFRRQLRWFPVLIDSLDGLILVRRGPAGGVSSSDPGISCGVTRGEAPLREPGARLPCDASVQHLALPAVAGRQDGRRDRPPEGRHPGRGLRQHGAGRRVRRAVQQFRHASGDRACAVDANRAVLVSRDRIPDDPAVVLQALTPRSPSE